MITQQQNFRCSHFVRHLQDNAYDVQIKQDTAVDNISDIIFTVLKVKSISTGYKYNDG